MDWTGSAVHLVDVFGKLSVAEPGIVKYLGIEHETENIVRIVYRAGWTGTSCEGYEEYRFVRYDTAAKLFYETQEYAFLSENYCGDIPLFELKLFVDSPVSALGA